MTIQSYWQLDVAQDAARSEPSARLGGGLFRDVRQATLNRYDYYTQIGQAAAQTAFDGLYLPHRPQSDDSAIVAAAIAREVPRLTLVSEFPASAGSAVYAAKQAVSFQRQTHDRLAWSIAANADEEDFDRIEEFLVVARGVHGTRPFSFSGTHFSVENGGFLEPLSRAKFPPVFLQGESEEALALSARVADVHLFAPAPIEVLRSRIEALDALAVRSERNVAFGLLQPILVREEEADARRDARRLGLGEDALVGDYGHVAHRLADLAMLGIKHFVFGAPSSLEEAYRVGQHVLPRFRALTERVASAA